MTSTSSYFRNSHKSPSTTADGSDIGEGSPSGDFNHKNEDGSISHVVYEKVSDKDGGRYAYTAKNGDSGSSCHPMSIERLYRGNDLQYAIYAAIKGKGAKPAPAKRTFTYDMIGEDGTTQKHSVELTASSTEDGAVTYEIHDHYQNGAWSTDNVSWEDIGSGQFGKEFTVAFNEHFKKKDARNTSDGSDSASVDTKTPLRENFDSWLRNRKTEQQEGSSVVPTSTGTAISVS